MTDDQKLRATKLKAAIAASSQATGGAPPEVRAAVLVLKEELREGGNAMHVLTEALGIHKTTVSRWQHDAGLSRRPAASGTDSLVRGAGFRSVRVADTKPTRIGSVSVPAPAARSLRVAHAPSGLVIDGLDVETLAALLRRMS